MERKEIELALRHSEDPVGWVQQTVNRLQDYALKLMQYDYRAVLMVKQTENEWVAEHDEIKFEIRDRQIIPMDDCLKLIEDGKYKCILLKIEDKNDD